MESAEAMAMNPELYSVLLDCWDEPSRTEGAPSVTETTSSSLTGSDRNSNPVDTDNSGKAVGPSTHFLLDADPMESIFLEDSKAPQETAASASAGSSDSCTPCSTNSSGGVSSSTAKLPSAAATLSTTGMATTSSTARQHRQKTPPPLQSDSSMELRANFIASQRAHGIPILSYPYNPSIPAATSSNMSSTTAAPLTTVPDLANTSTSTKPQAASSSGTFHPSSLRLLDTRHDPNSTKRAKNAKEQKRAQRITNLIDQLRTTMENDGWRVELKSKFHVLSRYVNWLDIPSLSLCDCNALGSCKSLTSASQLR